MAEMTVVGLHAGSGFLRRAELRCVGRRIEILALSEEPLLPLGGQPDPSASGAAVTVSSGPRTPRGANSALPKATVTLASLPGMDVMSRCFTFPAADSTRVKQMVAHRLETDLPVPMEQLVWGYRRLGRTTATDSTIDVLAQAARSERVTQYLTSLSSAGTAVDVLTTEAQAIGALCRYGLRCSDLAGTKALVLASSEEWLVAVVVGSSVRSVRRIHADAGWPELACRECRQCIEAEASLESLKQVLWCGSTESGDGPTKLGQVLGIAVKPAEVVDDLTDSRAERISADHLARFGPAIGLALAGLFDKEEILRLAGRDLAEAAQRPRRLEHLLNHPWRWVAAALALTVSATGIHLGSIGLESREMQQFLDDAGRSNAAMAELDPKIRAMNRLDTYRIGVEKVWAALCGPIPDNIVISSVQLARERGLVIKGTAAEPKSIFTLAEALRKSPAFAKVSPGRTEPVKGGSFTVTAELANVRRLSALGTRGAAWR